MATQQTVSFQCGHCHKVMGVTSAFLGKQVRCPHCQQVVLAPAQAPAAPPPAPPPPPPPPPVMQAPSRPIPDFGGFAAPNMPTKDEHESIFGEQVDEDLFSAAPKAKIELPPEPARPNLQLEPTMFQLPSLPAGAAPDPGPTVAVSVPNHAVPPVPQMAPNSAGTMEWNSAPQGGTDGGALQPVARVPMRNTDTTGNALAMYVLYALAAYSLFMTIVAIWMLWQSNKTPHPLEMIPDEGWPPATKSTSQTRVIERISPRTPLPPQLMVPLGQTLTVGDLEVTPTKVEQKLLNYQTRDGRWKTTPCEHDSLILHLHFKNISKDCTFRPTDSSWDRWWKEERDASKNSLPYTYLAANGHYYCGPYKWQPKFSPLKQGDNLRFEFVDGQEDDKKMLKPSEEANTVLITDPQDDVPALLAGYKNKMEWRVQLRRGLVRYKGKDISCSAVIGVEFTMDQVKKE
jgi:hypothetical protein